MAICFKDRYRYDLEVEVCVTCILYEGKEFVDYTFLTCVRKTVGTNCKAPKLSLLWIETQFWFFGIHADSNPNTHILHMSKCFGQNSILMF